MGIKRASEKEFMRTVVQYARLMGWQHYHTRDSRRSPPGFPDLVLVRGAELVFAELKTDKGQLTAEQREWIAKLSKTPARVFVWRPADWPAIEQTLGRGRREVGDGSA